MLIWSNYVLIECGLYFLLYPFELGMIRFLYFFLVLIMIYFLQKGGTPRVADFVHGKDGLGNTFLPPPKGEKIEKSASEFLVEKVSEYPSEVYVLAPAPLTNMALISCTLLYCILWSRPL